LFLLIISYLA